MEKSTEKENEKVVYYRASISPKSSSESIANRAVELEAIAFPTLEEAKEACQKLLEDDAEVWYGKDADVQIWWDYEDDGSFAEADYVLGGRHQFESICEINRRD